MFPWPRYDEARQYIFLLVCKDGGQHPNQRAGAMTTTRKVTIGGKYHSSKEGKQHILSLSKLSASLPNSWFPGRIYSQSNRGDLLTSPEVDSRPNYIGISLHCNATPVEG